jgi:antitoxin (DNA-binding transcriptional repressor) of toxin-antitoxin stability system
MIRVSVSEAKEKLEELIAKAAMGETVEITSNGYKATLRVTLYNEHDPPPRQWGLLKGKGWMSDDFNEPLDDFKEYMERPT